jgi:actin-related protein 3
MGFAGNDDPQFVIPTAIAVRNKQSKVGPASPIDDLDFVIGEEAKGAAPSIYNLGYPIRHGQIDNWDWMEGYWAQSFFRYLRVNPEEQPLLLTEPPLNVPENREMTGEIMFETFNVPAMYIAVQGVLALAASWGSAKSAADKPLTGVVVDSGDGVTHIIPVVEGYAISSAIKHIPVAGREITYFIQQLLRDRSNAGIPPEETFEAARHIKESHCYVCPDIAREFQKLDSADPSRGLAEFTWESPASKRQAKVSLGHECFLGPEIFFSPEIATPDFTTPLPALIDQVVQACPIDARRDLYKNVVLSGGSTTFRDFSKRLQRDLKTIVEERLAYAQEAEVVNKAGGQLAVKVVSHSHQKYAVWNGGSLFASMDQFPAYCTTKAEYEERGPSACRQSRVFGSLLS